MYDCKIGLEMHKCWYRFAISIFWLLLLVTRFIYIYIRQIWRQQSFCYPHFYVECPRKSFLPAFLCGTPLLLFEETWMLMLAGRKQTKNVLHQMFRMAIWMNIVYDVLNVKGCVAKIHTLRFWQWCNFITQPSCHKPCLQIICDAIIKRSLNEQSIIWPKFCRIKDSVD